MDAKVIWKGKLAFDGTAESKFSLPLDGRKSVGGEENGFRPMELFAIGLAGCTGMDVISILSKKRQDITAFEVQVHVDRATDYPTVFTKAIIEYLVTGIEVDEAALIRSIELSATRYCPAQAMLGKIMPIELMYKIFEDQGEGIYQEVKRGVYRPRAD
ncbi:MAG: OsmC family protein [Anaerolineales bacterium]|jgi:putative redox protein